VKLSGGDQVTGSLSLSAKTGKVTATLDDVTTGASSTYAAKVVDAAHVSDAYWFVDTSKVLAKFSPAIDFTNAGYSWGGSSHPISAFATIYEVTMEDTSHHVMATVSSLSSTGTSFTVTWKRST
jgi:hypothetical protein